MSLILDALRKSEAERQRGQAPSVFTATPGAPRTVRWAVPGWPLLLIGLLLLAAAWWVWRGDDGRDEPAQIATATSTAPTSSAEAERASTTDASPTLPAPTRSERPVAQAAPAIERTAPATAAPPASGKQSPAPSPPQAVAPAPPLPLPPPEQTPAEEALPTLAILDAGTRASLPPLKLSMHVWA